MRAQSLAFRLSAATAVAALLLGQMAPSTAWAQMVPPGAMAPGPTTAQQAADPPERVGRVASTSGTVSFHTQDADQWSPASANYPVATGNSYWTEPNASAQLEVSGNRVALAGGTELDVTALDQNGLQATVPQGQAYLSLSGLAPSETWSVQTPRGQVTFAGPGRYGIAAGDTQNPTTVTVLEGAAQVGGPGVALQVGPGQTATITGADSFNGSVGPAQTDAFLDAMSQADRPPPAAPAPAVVAQMSGGSDLAAYGSWADAPEYGQVWYPRVDPGWVPYREGHWAYVPPWGWTWVDDAPWGFAPFHYGRWVEIGDRWAWTPGSYVVAGPPVYAPALVTFFGIGAGIGLGAALAAGSVGWCPLGPREPYRPWYRASDRYLHDVNIHHVTNFTTINRNVTINNFINRRAVTVVPAAAMAASRPVRNSVQRVDPRSFATARPVFGAQPVRPTAATAGVTPGLVRPSAPGPAIHAARPGPGLVPRPAAAGPGPAPGLRPPEARTAGPPPIQHAPAGAPSAGGFQPPAQPGFVRTAPTAPGGGATQPFARPNPAQPAAPPRLEHGGATSPAATPRPQQPGFTRPVPAPAGAAPAPFARPAAPPHPIERPAMPTVQRPTSAPAPRIAPQVAPQAARPTFVAPRPAAPPPQFHPAAQPQPRPAPAPAPHPAFSPPPQFHPAAPPQPRPAPAPQPAPHVAPPAPHPAPQHERRPGQP